MSKEHEKLYLSNNLEYLNTSKSYDNYSTDDNIRFAVLNFFMVWLSLDHNSTIIKVLQLLPNPSSYIIIVFAFVM